MRAVGDAVSAELGLAGFEMQRVTPPPVAPADQWLEALMLPEARYSDVAEVVIGRRDFGGRGRVLVLGDLDTSFPPGSLQKFPFRLHEGRAYGPGTADMKGGLVVLAAALRALHDIGLQAPLVSVVLSPDEQAGSLRSRPIVETEARVADCCLCVECARDGGNLMGSRAQCGLGLLEVQGREAHAGSAHAIGANAIEALARKVSDLDAITDRELGRYVTVTLVRGGRRRSVVPASCIAVLDVRTSDAEDWGAIESQIGTIARRADVRDCHGTVKLHAHRPAVPWTQKTDRLIEVASRAGDALGINLGVVRSAAGGSSAFAGPLGVPVLDGMGPCGGGLMTQDEHVEVASLTERAALLALTLHRIGAGEAPVA